MKRIAFSLIELLVAIAILTILMGLLLPAIQRAREVAARIKCRNNLKQMGLAAHNFHNEETHFPSGSTPAPTQLSVQGQILPYLEQSNTYNRLDKSVSAHATFTNYEARVQQVPTYLCPSDPSSGAAPDESPPSGVTPAAAGRCNYYANGGAHGWFRESSGSSVKPPHLVGMFGFDTKVTINDVHDGSSNTVLFAEILRAAAPNHDERDVTVLMPNIWGGSAATNPNNFPLMSASLTAACNAAAGETNNLTGLQYYRGNAFTSHYTHTLPPGYTGRDCMHMSADQFHLAARSAHHGIVNVVLADGSVRAVSTTIPMPIWIALGTRAGGETDLD